LFFLQGELLKSSQSVGEVVEASMLGVEELQVHYKIPHLLLQQAPCPLQLGKEVMEVLGQGSLHKLEEVQQLALSSLRMEVDMELHMDLHPQEMVELFQVAEEVV